LSGGWQSVRSFDHTILYMTLVIKNYIYKVSLALLFFTLTLFATIILLE
jgi:hypothetical protein